MLKMTRTTQEVFFNVNVALILKLDDKYDLPVYKSIGYRCSVSSFCKRRK